MCEEMPVIPVNKVVDQKKIIIKKWSAEEEERHKGSLTQTKKFKRKISFFSTRKLLGSYRKKTRH
jgi:hypothetical protein